LGCYWPSTQPMSKKPASKSVEQHLKTLEDRVGTKPLVDSKFTNKRPSDPLSGLSGVPATKKPRRLLPRGYTDDEINEAKSNTKSNSRYFPPGSNTRAVNQTSSTGVQAAAAAREKVASVFLSHEQMQIKRLAVEGCSLFYTGSAGWSFLTRCYETPLYALQAPVNLCFCAR
jgi:hypothetical protein